jgi:hypothetical protein
MGGKKMPNGGFRAPPGKRWDSSWQSTHELPLGVVVGRSPAGDPAAAAYFRILVPLWLLVVVTGALPMLRLCLALRRWRKKAPGFCSKYGYDVRANEDRCPECGTAIGKTASSAQVSTN